MHATLYSNDIISPQISSISDFIETQFDHSWLVAALPPQLFGEMDMQELRLELHDIASYGAQGAQLTFALDKLEQLIKALLQLDTRELRRRLKDRGELSIQKDLILSTLDANALRLEDATRGIRDQF